MSTASAVPQTYELADDDARATLLNCGLVPLMKDAFTRFRAADGFSHSRALAFQVVLVFVPGLIAFVGFINVLNQDSLRRAAEKALVSFAPGPASQVFTQAFHQGTSSGTLPLLIGVVGALAAGTGAMGQLERGANRIYGVERDRPTVEKYTHAFMLAISAGVLAALAFVAFVAGSAFAGGFWSLIRWPAGILFAIAAFALLFKKSPRRRQPAASWLAHGSAISTLLWFLFTGLLALYLAASKSFGQTYGPLAGVIGLMLWAFLGALALHLGLAFAAQLEAVRAGVPSPQTGDERDDPPEFPIR